MIFVSDFSSLKINFEEIQAEIVGKLKNIWITVFISVRAGDDCDGSSLNQLTRHIL